MDIIAQRVRGVNTEWAAAQDNTMALRRVFEILETEPDVKDPDNPIPLTGFRREIAFDKVSFAYEPARPVLHEVSFSVKPGSVTAIVGPTGSGKSTLMAMLLRVFDPDSGRISIDGHDLREFSLDDLREQVSVAPQEPILFAVSVLDNIRYATPEASFEDVRRAAELACCEEFIAGLPHGYDTVLGDRGAGLSPGQKQRLCIARALVKDAPIVILDEPTAPLDAQTEHRVLDNLGKWAENRAIFIITHRLSTVRRADHILFLENGRLIEAGSHAEMMANADGRYRAMVDAESALAERGTAQ
jgi:ATP-binding cassette, subfamily B, bacterial